MSARGERSVYLYGVVAGVLGAPALISIAQKAMDIPIHWPLSTLVDTYRRATHALVDVIPLLPLQFTGIGTDIIPPGIKEAYFLLYSFSFLMFSMYMRTTLWHDPAIESAGQIKRLGFQLAIPFTALVSSLVFWGLFVPLAIYRLLRSSREWQETISSITKSGIEIRRMDADLRQSLAWFRSVGAKELTDDILPPLTDPRLETALATMRSVRLIQLRMLRSYFLSIALLIVITGGFYFLNSHLE